MRLDEFQTQSIKEWFVLRLQAWARYKRGDMPTKGEFEYINNRVIAKHPKAELVRMERSFVPSSGSEGSTEVWWEFEWHEFTKGGASC